MVRSRDRRRTVVAALILAILLVGCTTTTQASGTSEPPTSAAAQAPKPVPTPPVRVTPKPVPTTIPAPSLETVKPEVGELVITPTGIGSLTIGLPVIARPRKVALVNWKPDWCRANGKVGEPWVGVWEPAYSATAHQFYGKPYPFFVVTSRGEKLRPVTFVISWSPLIKTAQGISVGSTEAEVKRAYPRPNYVLTPSSTGTRLYVVDRAQGRMVIEVATAREWGEKRFGRVLWITAQSRNLKATSIAGTDSIGTCGA